jgi:hypothetical protein
MKMLAVFGQLLRSAKGKLKKQDDKSGKKDTGKVSQTPKTPKTLIWGVMDGPYSVEDFPEEDLEYMGIEDGYEWMLVCKIEEDGAVGLANFWYQTLDEALAVKYYFDSNIEPLEIDSD